MNRPIEKLLFIVSVAGVLAAVLMITAPVRTYQLAGPTTASAPTLHAEQATEATRVPAMSATVVSRESARSVPEAGEPAGTPDDAHDHIRDGTTVDQSTTTTVRYPPTAPAEEIAVAPDAGGPTRSDEAPAPTPPGGFAVPEPAQCPPIKELWVADGYPVADRCTLEEVREAVHLAYTGANRERRSAIRNGHLLDEVFAALDDFGRTHDAALFDPERRGETSVIFEGFEWRGGPDADRGVIAVRYRLDHPGFPPTDQYLDTLVQVDGKWRLSYRRSYCVKVLVIMEYIGSEVRCPRDPHPEVNEDEAPGSTGRYR